VKRTRLLNYLHPVLWIAVVVRYGFLLKELPARAKDWNFDLYYVAGLATLKGIDPARTDIAPLGVSLGGHFPKHFFSNATPIFRLIFTGLAHLNLTAAFWLWSVAGALALIGTFAILLSVVRPGREVGSLLVAALLLYPPTVECFWYAEPELIVLFLLAGAWWCMRRDAETAAGVAIGLAALLKAYPALIGGYLIATRRWRALASATITGVAGMAIAVGVLGVATLTGFLLEAHETFGWSFLNLSLSGFMGRMYWRLFTAHGNQIPHLMITLAAQTGALALAYGATRRRPADDDGRCYALWVVTALVDSPIVWLAYLVLLIIPITVLVGARRSANGRSLWAAAVSMVVVVAIPALGPHFLDSRIWHLVSEVQFLALASAYASAYWLATDDNRASGASMAAEGVLPGGK
jgi:Glycosyltransferase family 87